MPTWTNHLPPEGKHTGFDLRRTPTSGSIIAVITSDDMVICDTHFFHGRTTPCEREVNEEGNTIDDARCPACREKAGFRTHAYVSAFDLKRREHFLYECTAHAAKAFAEYREATQTLRGCSFVASRPKGTPNGKVAIVCNTVNLAKVSLPEPPDLPRALCVIWRLPLPALETTPRKHRPPKATTAAGPLKAMRDQPDNVMTGDQLQARRKELLDALATADNGNGHATTAKANA